MLGSGCHVMPDNIYAMHAREQKARRLADYLYPKLREAAIPISELEEMTDAWWRVVAFEATVAHPPSLECRGMVIQFLYDRQKEERNAQGNQGGAGNTAA